MSSGSDGSALVPLRRGGVRHAGLVPFGLGKQKPHHFVEMVKVAWRNRRHLAYAWKVLTRGVCDGCALGTTGLRDWTMEGVHLCAVRLNLLRLNTMGKFPAARLGDAAALAALDGQQLRELGRIPTPLRRRRGETGFTPVSWDEALAELGGRLRAVDPDRFATFMTARGITNEVYYAVQKVARFLGSPHIDNAARLCHAPSTAAMKRVLGLSASTCSYRDWYGTDVIVFFGSNPANDQPVALKYLHEAKKRGTRVLVVNTVREPGMERYWIPSTPSSALFGTVIADDFFHVGTGGDLAFLHAVQRMLIDGDAIDEAFIDAHTEGFAAYRDGLRTRDLDQLIARSGASRADVERFTAELARASTGVFVWSMGLTQHEHGSDTVAALCCLGLSKGFVGRERCGLMPIRGHSGVQGGAEMGAYANVFPGGQPIDEENAATLARSWGFAPPARVGRSTTEMVAAAGRGELDVFYMIGGNLRDTLPDPRAVEAALARVPVRIHQDLAFTHPMLIDPADVVYVLPARTRYEHRGGVTETTTERRVVFSPYIPGHELGDAQDGAEDGPREEWWIARELARAAHPARAAILGLQDAAAIRREIAALIPSYRGIEALEKAGDAFQWGGPRLCEGGVFPRPGGRARFELTTPPARKLGPDQFLLSTRRGKQFNSMIQAQIDGLTGAARDHVLMNPADLARLALVQDQRVRLVSAHGSFLGRARGAAITPGNLQMHWPEANVLIAARPVDAAALVPDYNAVVKVEVVR
jgi:molybdopterin-dependent oxidoreductase alpha subunit